MYEKEGNAPQLFILHAYLLPADQRIGRQSVRVQIFFAHVNGSDLPVFIGGIVIHTAGGAAGGIDGDLRLVFNDHAAAGMRNASQNMEELRDTLLLRVAALGVRLHEYGTDKP